jgi:Bacterial Ig domain
MFRTAAIGYRTTISAADRFLSGGREWVFDQWSDGGARVHDVTVPASAITLTAVYRGVGGTGPASPTNFPASRAGRDVTRPRVRITAPARGATVSGRIRVRAIALDNVGVRVVRFKLDGTRLGRPDSKAPFRLRWDTRTVRNGPHRLTAVARDAAGNANISAVVRFRVRNERGRLGR